MKQFHFRLERLLEIKRYYEREAEIQLAKKTGEIISLQNNIENRQQQLSTMSIFDKSGGPVSIDRMAVGSMYQYRLHKEIEKFKKEIEEKEKERVELQTEYIEASKQRKVFEKLKEKREKEYYKKQLKEEHKLIDEIGTHASAQKLQQ